MQPGADSAGDEGHRIQPVRPDYEAILRVEGIVAAQVIKPARSNITFM